MKIKIYSFLFILFCSTFSSLLYSQSTDLKFEKLNTENGLSYNQVTCMRKDLEGFMWIGTSSGLNYFDGSKVTVFRHSDGDSTTLCGNQVNAMEIDRAGNLWLATDKGICRMDHRHRFRTFSGYTKDPEKLWTHAVYITKDETVWFSCIEGLGKIDPVTYKMTIYPVFGGSSRFTQGMVIGAIYEDRRGTLWLGSCGGLFKFDRQKGIVIPFRMENTKPGTNSKGDNCIQCFYQDADAVLWVGTWGGGLKKIDLHTNEVNTFYYNGEGDFASSNIVRSITESAVFGKGKLWLGTAEKGLLAFDKAEEKFTAYAPDAADRYALSSVWVSSLLDDADNQTLWVGTTKGLDKIDYNAQRFPHSTLDLPKLNYPEFNYISSLLTDKSDPSGNTIWLGIDYNGLLKYNLQDRRIEKIILPESPDKFKGKAFEVKSLYQDKNNIIWIGTLDWLYRLDPVSYRLEKYNCNPATGKSALCFIQAIQENRRGNLWLGTTQGLLEFDPVLKKITAQYRHDTADTGSLNYTIIFNLATDAQQRLWLGMQLKSLDQYNESHHTFIHYADSVKANPTGAMLVDHANNLWIGTDNGLFRRDAGSGKFSVYREKDGLQNSFVHQLAEDDQHAIWIGTRDGLFRLAPPYTDFTRYTTDDGLAENDLEWPIVKTKAGELLIGSKGGFYRFWPADIKPRPYSGKAKITAFKIFETAYPVDPETAAHEATIISYRQNIITFEFAAPDYSHASNVQYAYMLEGFDKSWTYCGHKTAATYTNLDGGNYTFKVKAANADGVWNNDAARFRLCITPPFWKTWWFRLLAVIAVLAAIYAVYRFNINKIRAEEKQKTSFNKMIAEAEMKALRAQMNPHFIFNCMNTIDSYILKNDQENASLFLNKFSKLIRLVLENSMHKYITLERDLEALELYLQLEHMRFDRNFSYSITCEKQLQESDAKIPPLLIQPYVENAILHGLRHKEGGRLLEINLTIAGDHIICIVSDNGIGREKAAAMKQANAHTPVGLRVTENRIAVLNTSTAKKAGVEITDLYDAQQKAIGTKVILTIPVL